MHQVDPLFHTEQIQTNLVRSDNHRKSEFVDDQAKKAKNDLDHVPADEVRLSGAVRKIMASAAGTMNNQSAALLAYKIASSDPALAKQAFGRIMSAVTFSLLLPAENIGSPPDDRFQELGKSEELTPLSEIGDVATLASSSETPDKSRLQRHFVDTGIRRRASASAEHFKTELLLPSSTYLVNAYLSPLFAKAEMIPTECQNMAWQVE